MKDGDIVFYLERSKFPTTFLPLSEHKIPLKMKSILWTFYIAVRVVSIQMVCQGLSTPFYGHKQGQQSWWPPWSVKPHFFIGFAPIQISPPTAGKSSPKHTKPLFTQQRMMLYLFIACKFFWLSCMGSKLSSKQELRCCWPADTTINNISATNSN